MDTNCYIGLGNRIGLLAASGYEVSFSYLYADRWLRIKIEQTSRAAGYGRTVSETCEGSASEQQIEAALIKAERKLCAKLTGQS